MFLKSSFDYLIVGLGNIGMEYENTRHNAGFMAADRLSQKFSFDFNRHKLDAVYGETVIASKRVIVAKPQTFMNNSGRCVTKIASFYKIPYDKVIIIFDDISLDVGKIRLRSKGSAGGHNGMKDIIQLSGTEDIMRIKIGVGAKPHPDYDLVKWVLGKIPTEQKEEFLMSVNNAADAVEEIIANGMQSAMNKYSK